MVKMRIISKTVVKQEGKSDRWPRYRIVREYYFVDEQDANNLSFFDEAFWNGNGWGEKNKAFLYTNLEDAVMDKDNIGDLI